MPPLIDQQQRWRLRRHGANERFEVFAVRGTALKIFDQGVQHRLPLTVLAKILAELGQKHQADEATAHGANGNGISKIYTTDQLDYLCAQIGRR